MKNDKPRLIIKKHITYEGSKLIVSIYETTYFYDIVLSANMKTLQDIKTANDMESTIIKDSIFKAPILVYNTTEKLKDIKQTYNKIKELLKWKYA